MKKLSVLLFVLVYALGCTVAEARHRHSHQPAGSSVQSQNLPGQFDYYLLALSWSPEFCTTPAGRQPTKQQQCGQSLGFVVHGLWPQFNNGGWPADCDSSAPKNVPNDIANIVLTAQPPMPPGDAGLLSHEWTKHGTCSGLDQRTYFTKIKAAAEKVKIPPELQDPATAVSLDFSAIVSQFSAANPGLSAEMMDSSADAHGNISEIHICFSKELAFQACTGSRNNDEGGKFLPVRTH